MIQFQSRSCTELYKYFISLLFCFQVIVRFLDTSLQSLRFFSFWFFVKEDEELGEDCSSFQVVLVFFRDYLVLGRVGFGVQVFQEDMQAMVQFIRYMYIYCFFQRKLFLQVSELVSQFCSSFFKQIRFRFLFQYFFKVVWVEFFILREFLV